MQQSMQGGSSSPSLPFRLQKDSRKLCFLIIDGASPSSRQVLRRMLEQYMGHAVEEASDANEAAALLIAAAKGGSSSEAVQFDAVFIDCTLPSMDGAKAARTVRSTGEASYMQAQLSVLTLFFEWI